MTRSEAIQRIRDLQAVAERTTYPEEADTARLKIERLKTKFAVEPQEMAEPPTEPVNPAWPFPPDVTVVFHFQQPFVHNGGAFMDTATVTSFNFVTFF